MLKRVLCSAAAAFLLFTGPVAAEWQPDRPVTIIVPWGAGGSTDQIVRLLAAEMEDAFDATFVIVNQPGAQGAIGTKSVLDAPRDGYTWASGAAKDLGTYPVTDMLDTRIEDWHLFLAVINTSVISVNADTPYQDVNQLVEAMRETPGQITVGTAGVNSSGGAALSAFSAALGVEAQQVTYDGGNPASIATAAGETLVTTQLAADQAAMIRAGRLRPLAVLGSKSLTLDGYGEIPPITEFIPDYPVTDNYFGVFIPRGVPDEVVAAVEQVWSERLEGSTRLDAYGREQGAIVALAAGEAAQQAVQPAVREMAWLLYDSNQAKVDPSSLGIPRP